MGSSNVGYGLAVEVAVTEASTMPKAASVSAKKEKKNLKSQSRLLMGKGLPEHNTICYIQYMLQ